MSANILTFTVAPDAAARALTASHKAAAARDAAKEALERQSLTAHDGVMRAINTLLADPGVPGVYASQYSVWLSLPGCAYGITTPPDTTRISCILCTQYVPTYAAIAEHFTAAGYEVVSATLLKYREGDGDILMTITIPTEAELSAKSAAEIGVHLWINSNRIDWPAFSRNPHPKAVAYLRANPHRITWQNLAQNPNADAIEMCREHFALKPGLYDASFSYNPNPIATKLLQTWLAKEPRNQYSVYWSTLCKQPNAIAVEMIRANLGMIGWENLSTNPHPDALALMLTSPQKISWSALSRNTNPQVIVQILRANPLMIVWYELSANATDEAVALLRENPDKIEWSQLSRNSHPWAVAQLAANPDKIDVAVLSNNTSDWAMNWLYDNLTGEDGAAFVPKVSFSALCNNTNPLALRILALHPDKWIGWQAFSANPILFPADPPKWRVKSWVDVAKLDWEWLSQNAADGAVEMLANNRDKIDWAHLSANAHPWAVKQLQSLQGDGALSAQIDVGKLCANTSDWAMERVAAFVRDSPALIDWELLSANESPAAVAILRANRDKIDWSLLSANGNPDAIAMLKEKPEKIVWTNLSCNNSDDAIAMLRIFSDKIDWNNLGCSENAAALTMLREHVAGTEGAAPDWAALSQNLHPIALEMIAANVDKIDWEMLSTNQGIFEANI